MGGSGASLRQGPSFKQLSAAEADQMVQDRYGSASEADRLGEDYVGKAQSMDINRALRNDFVPSRFESVVDRMDSAMKPLGEDIQLTRYVDTSYFRDILGGNLNSIDASALRSSNVGKIVQEKAYMSTSYDATSNVFTSYPVKMNISAPSSTKAFVTNNHFESEVILARNTRYVITNVRQSSQIEVDVTILP